MDVDLHVSEAAMDGDQLVVHFAEGYVLRVEDPSEIAIDPEAHGTPALAIREARRVLLDGPQDRATDDSLVSQLRRRNGVRPAGGEVEPAVALY
jgi:hypothetical protein